MLRTGIRCICWLIFEVILRNARCNDEIHKKESISAKTLIAHWFSWKAADSPSKCHNSYGTLPPTIVV